MDVRKLVVKRTTFARSDSHMNRAFIQGIAREKFEIFQFMTISVMPQLLGSWQLCHYMLCGQRMR